MIKHPVIFVITGFIFICMLIEAQNIKKLYYNIKDLSPNIKIPPNFKGKKIIFVSDIQLDSGFGFANNLAKKFTNLVQKENPDIILFGGDFINYENKNANKIFPYLAELKAPLGKYGVLGNHDYMKKLTVTDGTFIKEGLKKAGINLLLNENIEIKIGDDNIKIAGIDELWYGNIDMEKTMRGITKDDTTIFMMHNPDYFEIMSENYKNIIDLTLTGHTHAGQFTLFGLCPLIIIPTKYGKKYLYGAKNFNGNHIYITSGIGGIFLFGLPLRLFAKPEIVIIKL